MKTAKEKSKSLKIILDLRQKAIYMQIFAQRREQPNGRPAQSWLRHYLDKNSVI